MGKANGAREGKNTIGRVCESRGRIGFYGRLNLAVCLSTCLTVSAGVGWSYPVITTDVHKHTNKCGNVRPGPRSQANGSVRAEVRSWEGWGGEARFCGTIEVAYKVV